MLSPWECISNATDFFFSLHSILLRWEQYQYNFVEEDPSSCQQSGHYVRPRKGRNVVSAEWPSAPDALSPKTSPVPAAPFVASIEKIPWLLAWVRSYSSVGSFLGLTRLPSGDNGRLLVRVSHIHDSSPWNSHHSFMPRRRRRWWWHGTQCWECSLQSSSRRRPKTAELIMKFLHRERRALRKDHWDKKSKGKTLSGRALNRPTEWVSLSGDESAKKFPAGVVSIFPFFHPVLLHPSVHPMYVSIVEVLFGSKNDGHFRRVQSKPRKKPKQTKGATTFSVSSAAEAHFYTIYSDRGRPRAAAELNIAAIPRCWMNALLSRIG